MQLWNLLQNGSHDGSYAEQTTFGIDGCTASYLFVCYACGTEEYEAGDKSKVWGISDKELTNAKKKLEDHWNFMWLFW